VADLEAVRKAIGADTINLVGVSYGTRMAQQYALRHPQHVRTITLDSPVPNTLGLGNIFAGNLDSALRRFTLCKESPTCKPAWVTRGRAAIRADPPARESASHLSTAAPARSRDLTADHVAGLVRMVRLHAGGRRLLPQLIRSSQAATRT
jgi:pimeloyl-ACP methyl ester carboxylesterase